MHRFHDKIYRTLTDFRQSFNHKWPKCLREDFPFDQLKISRTQLKSFSDLALYELAMFLSKLIKSHIEKKPCLHRDHQEMQRFLDDLDHTLNQYICKSYRIIHKKQAASIAHVTAVQLINLPKEKLSEDVAKKIRQCGKRIARFGTNTQQQHFAQCLRKNQHKHNYFFLVQLSYFEMELQNTYSD